MNDHIIITVLNEIFGNNIDEYNNYTDGVLCGIKNNNNAESGILFFTLYLNSSIACLLGLVSDNEDA